MKSLMNLLDDTESESDEETPVKKEAKVTVECKDLAKPKANAVKVDSLAPKLSVKSDELKKADSEDEEDEDESGDEFGDEDMLDGEDDSDEEGKGEGDEDESSEEDDDATPKRAEIGKKRAAESASKTPGLDKKAKLVTPISSQKTGGADCKKGGYKATPYPLKQTGKTPATNDKLKQQTPKSAGSVSCKSCTK